MTADQFRRYKRFSQRTYRDQRNARGLCAESWCNNPVDLKDDLAFYRFCPLCRSRRNAAQHLKRLEELKSVESQITAS